MCERQFFLRRLLLDDLPSDFVSNRASVVIDAGRFRKNVSFLVNTYNFIRSSWSKTSERIKASSRRYIEIIRQIIQAYNFLIHQEYSASSSLPMMPAHPPQLLTMGLVSHRANARYDIECLYFFHEDYLTLERWRHC